MPRTKRLRDERTVQLNIPIPYLLRDRLVALQEVLDDADLPDVPIRELVATLILLAEDDGKKLRDLVETYRNAPPERAAIVTEGGKIVPFRKRAPGRPPKRS